LGCGATFIRSIKAGTTSIRAIIIGTGERAKELSLKLRERAEWGIKIIGHLDPDPARVGWRVLDAPVIGTIDDIHNILKQHVVDEIIIAIPRSLLADAEPIAFACEEEGIKLRFMADVFSLHVARVRLTQAGDLPLLNLEPVAQDEVALLIKRAFDLTLTLLSMPVVLPIMAIIAIAVKLDSPGPVLFVQQRVGLKKRQFPMMKFRSMCDRAEDKLCEVEHLNQAEGPIFKITDDPRITRVGRFIRKTSLDELPQLFNVIRGEMSLVGPRPMSIRDVDLFDRGIQRKRFSVKPGLTCIWQISGRSNLPFEKWLELDLQYIESWCLWLDFKILFKTIPAVLFPNGAW
jgi:exopolysaccharide biosynthesis polyprenyl glycosylphosphotransferase